MTGIMHQGRLGSAYTPAVSSSLREDIIGPDEFTRNLIAGLSVMKPASPDDQDAVWRPNPVSSFFDAALKPFDQNNGLVRGSQARMFDLMTDQQLIYVLLMCVEKMPGEVLRHGQLIASRLLGGGDQLLMQAASQPFRMRRDAIPSLSNVPEKVALRALETLRYEAHERGAVARFLVSMALKLGDPRGKQFVRDHAKLVDTLDPMVVYRGSYTLRKDASVKRGFSARLLVAQWLDGWLLDRARESGYRIGIAKRGSFRVHGELREQLLVEADGKLFVQNGRDRSSTYHPRAGERLCFHRNTFKNNGLPPNVLWVRWEPVDVQTE